MSGGCDLVIIGAGPAGLSAARQASDLGLKTVLLDEQPAEGGQIYRGQGNTPLADLSILGPEYARGRRLAEAFRQSKAEYVSGATVFEATRDGWVGFECAGKARFLHTRALIVATGAMERPFPIPGWTLPGVMTAGAAQILLKSAGAVPGRQTILAGTGPLLYLLAWQLIQAGHAPSAVLDTTERANYLRAAPKLAGAVRRTDQLVKGAKLIAAIRRAGIPHIRGVTDLAAEGDGTLAAVRFRQGGRSHRLETDLLLLHQGVVPNIQLPAALRCALAWDDAQLCWKPVTDAWGKTSQEHVYVAGDGAGILGAVAAEFTGQLAAIGAAAALGRIGEGDRDRLAAPLRAALSRERAIRPFLDSLYRPPDQFRIPATDDVIVCRCEEATAGDVRNAVALGCLGPNQLKAFVRAGMGPCQGRLCGLTVCETMAKARRVPPSDVGYYRLRMPVKPVALGTLADMSLDDMTSWEDAQIAGEQTLQPADA